jgi:hypothetical protein
MQSQIRSLFWMLAPFLWYAWMRMSAVAPPAPCAHSRPPAAHGGGGGSGGSGGAPSWSVSAPQLEPLDRDGAAFGAPPPSSLEPPPPPAAALIAPAGGGGGGGGGAPRAPRAPRAPGLPLPPLPSLALWGADSALPALRGTCWTLRPQAPKAKDAPPDDFLYEVCFGDRIKQVQHPILGRAVLGVFAGFGEGGAQLYKGGSVCEGWGNREVEVAVVCDKKAVAEPVLWDIKEPDVCKYRMEVRSAHAC